MSADRAEAGERRGQARRELAHAADGRAGQRRRARSRAAASGCRPRRSGAAPRGRGRRARGSAAPRRSGARAARPGRPRRAGRGRRAAAPRRAASTANASLGPARACAIGLDRLRSPAARRDGRERYPLATRRCRMTNDALTAELTARLGETPIPMKEVARSSTALARRARALGALGRPRGAARASGTRRRASAALRSPTSCPLPRATARRCATSARTRCPPSRTSRSASAARRARTRARPRALYGFNFQSLGLAHRPRLLRRARRPGASRGADRLPRGPARGARPAGRAPRRNEPGVARFVYGFMVDRLRRVSEHVTIGSAARNGKDLGSWFLLTREP